MIHGVTFNNQLVTSADMAHAHFVFSGKQSGVTKGCAVSYSGRNIYVAAGAILTCGRLTQVTSQETIQAPAVSSGTQYCRLVYEVDLSKTNTESSFNQGYFKIIQNGSSYPGLTKQNLDEGGTVYQLPFARFTVTSSGIGNFADERVTFDSTATITLTTGNWSSVAPFTQTVSVDFVTANDKPTQGLIYPENCTDAQRTDIQKAAALIVGITTGNGTITFTATQKPETNITLGLHI